MSSFDLEQKLNKHLSRLTWQGSTDLDDAGRETLKAWLQEFFQDLLQEKNVKDYLQSDLGASFGEINISQAVSKCLGDSKMMENDYYGAFFMIFGSLRLSAEEAARSGRKILWKDLQRRLKQWGIKQFQGAYLPLAAGGTDTRDMTEEIPLLEVVGQSLKSSGTPLPTLVGIISVLLEEVGKKGASEWTSWVHVWDSAHARRDSVGDAGLVLSAAFQEVITLLMRGEFSLEMRGQLLTCLKLIFDEESFMSWEREAIFSFDTSTGEVRQAPGRTAVSNFLMSFAIAHSDNAHLLSDQQLLKDQFDDYSSILKSPPINLILDAAQFVNSISAENFRSSGMDPEGTSLKTLLMLALFAPRPPRQWLANVIDELAES